MKKTKMQPAGQMFGTFVPAQAAIEIDAAAHGLPTSYTLPSGATYPVKKYIFDRVSGGHKPLVEIPMMSDFKWQWGCLESRYQNPECYPQEDIPAVIAELRAWLLEHGATEAQLDELAAKYQPGGV